MGWYIRSLLAGAAGWCSRHRHQRARSWPARGTITVQFELLCLKFPCLNMLKVKLLNPILPPNGRQRALGFFVRLHTSCPLHHHIFQLHHAVYCDFCLHWGSVLMQSSEPYKSNAAHVKQCIFVLLTASLMVVVTGIQLDGLVVHRRG